MRLARISFRSLVLCVASLLSSSLACAQATSVVGIVEGGATLIRQTTRYALAEGVALNDQDIIETAPGAFAQIELPGGVLVGVGESTRLMLRPRVGKGLTPPPLYLLQGWLKTSTSGAFGYASPTFEIATQAGTIVVYTTGAQYEVFLESGAARLKLRDGAQTTAQLASGDFAQKREGATLTVARRATPEFLAKVPRQFRDRLPARGEQFAKRNVAPKALGEVAYTDVAAWLRTEPALRLPLLPLWRSRAADLTFRAAAKAELAQHPEWEPYADPEGYARRMAEEAERRRAREAARQAARQAARAAAPASGTGAGWGKP
ncbi:FecR domain-containing protein [Caenimonas soli]|uniref:FecR domain-containing protein n=1 Tax=Caenimonas soli TaxID=2735555 RepID=UPI0015561152|nr:FecR family protein [Caenimonas soli]NPC56507.1 FecR domain-containing protein [Caenimonas soli]